MARRTDVGCTCGGVGYKTHIVGCPALQIADLYDQINDLADKILDAHAADPEIDTTIRGAAQINYFDHLKRYHRWDGQDFIGYGWSEGGDFVGEMRAEIHEAEHEDAARWIDHDIDNPIYHTHEGGDQQVEKS